MKYLLVNQLLYLGAFSAENGEHGIWSFSIMKMDQTGWLLVKAASYPVYTI